MNVSEAVASRRSIRRFRDRPVDPALLRDVLDKARRAPSGGNLQPWHIHVVTGQKLIDLKQIVARQVAAMPAGEGTEYDIYPKLLNDPYRTRTFELGQLLYERLGIPREDKAARARWFARNFEFFGAPVGLFCYVDRNHGPPQWSDLGMYLQTVMLLLREAGLDSCPQECWALYPHTIGDFLGTPPEQMLFTGMSIGWRDEDAAENNGAIPRASIEEVVHFHAL
ncbi:MAG: dehydrogenase [Sphingomonadales bacterium]|nr:dehydrogenase [Sphingomonadales bacterium]